MLSDEKVRDNKFLDAGTKRSDFSDFWLVNVLVLALLILGVLVLLLVLLVLR